MATKTVCDICGADICSKYIVSNAVRLSEVKLKKFRISCEVADIDDQIYDVCRNCLYKMLQP